MIDNGWLGLYILPQEEADQIEGYPDSFFTVESYVCMGRNAFFVLHIIMINFSETARVVCLGSIYNDPCIFIYIQICSCTLFGYIN